MGNIKKNLLYNMGYQILIMIVPLITTPYVSRVLGPDGLGTFSVTTSIVKYYTLFAVLGMANYGTRTITKHKSNEKDLSVAFWNLFYFQLITSSLMT
ncbi:MAG: oligosaccharide flippase family protein, partial [Erysipelotrichaceae bacterium]|nr:oligosaccharide flippase family protein [Erysipelotrichaceae bacterium]